MNRINATAPAERNKQPIFARLAPLLHRADHVLEIGAGNGAHARHALACLAQVHWQATEHPARMAELTQALAAQPRLPAPVALDVTGAWPEGPFAAVYAANVAHIMAWPAVAAMVAGSARVLAPGGLLCLYGPFFDARQVTAPSNLEFDQLLRSRDPAMGLRSLQAVHELAADNGFDLCHDWAMPANNRLLVWALA
ncbi:MAG TPA: DUF938 domain-containing protein [Salinisphaeraceae bacterium]|nr:DUF938 domain-containing protein [Salinisphaeraceae bacterium]